MERDDNVEGDIVVEGNDKITNSRASNWTYEQHLQLINLYIDPDMQKEFNSGQRSHKQTWDRLAAKLTQRDGTTGAQAKEKWGKLKSLWREQQKKLKSGAAAPTFEFWFQMKSFLQVRKTNDHGDALDTGRDENFSGSENLDASTSSQDSPRIPSSNKRRPKRKREEDEFNGFMKNIMQENAQIARDANGILRELVTILGKTMTPPQPFSIANLMQPSPPPPRFLAPATQYGENVNTSQHYQNRY